MTSSYQYLHFKELKNYPKDCLKPQLLRELEIKDLVKIEKDYFKFLTVGFVFILNKILVIFPKVYNDQELTKSDIKILFHTLEKYKKSSNLEEKEYEQLEGDNNFHTSNVLISFNIIKDFLENNVLSRIRKSLRDNIEGKINWQKTINYKNPIFSQGNVLYHNPITIQTVFDRDNMLVRLHEYAIHWSVKEFGWLFNIDMNDISLFQNEIPCDSNEALIILKRELSESYSDRDMYTIKILINFYQSFTGSNITKSISTLSTPYFEYIWEEICAKLFKDEKKSLEDIIPRPVWSLDSTARVKKQNPDTLYVKDDDLYVIDAKYYDINSNLPGWGDLVKQFFYAHTIKGKLEIMKKNEFNSEKNLEKIKRIFLSLGTIYNIFIFPSSKSNEASIISYLGNTKVEYNKDLGKIYSFGMDIKKAMSNYIDGKINSDIYRHALQNEIETYLL